jgi:predicted PurR-regulated permease PerM
VTLEKDARSRDYVRRALEVSVHVGLLISLTAACYLILRPFLPLIVWGMVIAIALYPGYLRVAALLGGRNRLAAVLCTILLLALLIIPAVLMASTLVQSTGELAGRIREGKGIIPPPPPSIGNWPLIGVPLKDAWSLASTNLSAALSTFAPQIRAALPELFSLSAGLGLAVLQLILAILVAGALLANAAGAANVAHLFTRRLFGSRGAEFELLAGSTIRSVTSGIIGVALIQSIFAGLGFLVFGLPGAGLWAVIFLFAAVVQVGGLVLVPAVIYMFAISSTAKGALFLIWCVFVGVMDNVLKPLLLGRGVAVPVAVVFLGAIGGFVAMGILGLFIGAVILSVGYKLYLAWLEGPAEITVDT